MIWGLHHKAGHAFARDGLYLFAQALPFSAQPSSSSTISTCSASAQVWRRSDRPASRARWKFRTPSLYLSDAGTLIYVGWLIIFLGLPTMSRSPHLVFAVVTTAYILVAIQLEERDLIRHAWQGLY